MFFQNVNSCKIWITIRNRSIPNQQQDEIKDNRSILKLDLIPAEKVFNSNKQIGSALF